MADQCDKPTLPPLSSLPLLENCQLPEAPQPILDCNAADLPAPPPLVDLPCPLFSMTASAYETPTGTPPQVFVDVTQTKNIGPCGVDQCVTIAGMQFFLPQGPPAPCPTFSTQASVTATDGLPVFTTTVTRTSDTACEFNFGFQFQLPAFLFDPQGLQNIFAGFQGLQGPRGFQGPMGIDGIDGIDGPVGPRGAPGPRKFASFIYLNAIAGQVGHYAAELISLGASPSACGNASVSQLISSDPRDVHIADPTAEDAYYATNPSSPYSDYPGPSSSTVGPNGRQIIEVIQGSEVGGSVSLQTENSVGVGCVTAFRADGTPIIVAIQPEIVKPGRVVSAGPNGESDFLDERYWVQLIDPTNTYAQPLSTLDSPEGEATGFCGDTSTPKPQIVCVYNLPEYVYASPGSSTHLLPLNTVVTVAPVHNDTGSVLYVMALSIDTRVGQYMGMHDMMTSQNQRGFSFPFFGAYVA